MHFTLITRLNFSASQHANNHDDYVLSPPVVPEPAGQVIVNKYSDCGVVLGPCLVLEPAGQVSLTLQAHNDHHGFVF